MGWESSDVSDLTLGPSFKFKRGQPNLKVFVACLLLVLEVFNVKPTYKKSWAGNLLMWTDLTLVPSFKDKRWFTGFVSCLAGGYKFASVLQCIGVVVIYTLFNCAIVLFPLAALLTYFLCLHIVWIFI